MDEQPLARIPRFVRLRGESRTQITNYLRERYESGASLRELEREVGRSYGTIRLMLLEACVKLRARGGNHRHPKDTKQPPLEASGQDEG